MRDRMLAAVPCRTILHCRPSLWWSDCAGACIATWARDWSVAADRAAAAPFLGSRAGIIALIVSVALYQADGRHCRCAETLMRDLVPESDLGVLRPPSRCNHRGRDRTRAGLRLLIDTWKRNAPANLYCLFDRVHRQQSALGLFGVWLLSITPEQAMPSAWRAHAYSQPAGGTIPRSELPAADGLLVVVNFAATSPLRFFFSVLFGLAVCSLGLYSLHRTFIRGETAAPPIHCRCAICCSRRADRSTACRALLVCSAWCACRCG